jgi:ATP-dependent exoDNAse (exonuclease V) alpha subunit
VIGLTSSTNAARVLSSEGLGESYNLADFLGKIKDSTLTRGHLPVRAGDLLVVDEASMVTTADLAAVEDIATASGAKILLTGDTAQLSAPEAGGAMRLLAAEHGQYELRTVHRLEHAWEAAASLRLRDGDASALAEYDQRGPQGGVLRAPLAHRIGSVRHIWQRSRCNAGAIFLGFHCPARRHPLARIPRR